ncbi:uncharacterized protein [Miscanthus floridulus]|uniref:uncharacterized protein n=1 Tax=Miscanthus floridulus TaxID=154761 RepID=UPI0034592124
MVLIFPPSRAAASLLARLPKPAQRASEPARARQPTSRAGLLTPSRAALASAQPRAVPLLAARPCADRGRELPPRGDHVPASPAARQPRPDPAPTRPPTPAGARALAHSRPRCLPSPPEPRAPSSALAAPTHPPAKFVAASSPRPAITRPQLRLALLQVALVLAPPSELRLSLPEARHRRPWRRRARPPWKSSSFSSTAPPSYPTALAVFSRIPCARQLALPWPEMAAGRWPSHAAAKSRRRRVPFASAELGQSGRGPKPLPGHRAPLSLGPRGPKVAMGQLISSGLAQ